MSAYFIPQGERIKCTLCPHYCNVAPGRTGICGVRKNNGTEIVLTTYGIVSGYSLDPVEKKPLYHFFPGHNIFSVGSFGCNMRCDFCQNYGISQVVPHDSGRKITAEEIISAMSSSEHNIGIAFTYNEPTISFEFIRDISRKVIGSGYKTVLVSNGYVNIEPLKEIISFTDAFNIDLKAFDQEFHKKLTGANLQPVLESLKLVSRSGRHLEITSLIIPGFNDTEEGMKKQAEWIAAELGPDVPLHLSRYYPMYKRDDPATSNQTLERLYDTASGILDYVYIGNLNLNKGQNTYCPSCGKTITERSGYRTINVNADSTGNCSGCGRKIYKEFIFSSQKDR
ncbi:MAG TPA: AmmeMemoRadiSam system radical SAM enzyme [Bacteroidales bacterium]|nr:AmmeMemoRadiSam system radical SAM enzyme [Bacteroidales bacterium]